MTSTADTILMDVEAAIQGLETVLPTVLGVVGVFSPAAKALVPFLPLLQVALTTVQQIQTVVDGNVAQAVQTVTSTLTQSVPSTTNAMVPAPGTQGG